MSPETALRYLQARKLDVQKAVQLYQNDIETRRREGLYGIDSKSDPLSTELATGKFTILVVDKSYKNSLNFLNLVN